MSLLAAVCAVVLLANCGTAAESGSPRERLSFNTGWLFAKGDPEGSTAKLDYPTLKPLLLKLADGGAPEENPGSDVSFTRADFDDTAWRRLNLPHDWGIEGPFKQEYPGETGKLPWWGVAWYRKHFSIPATDAGMRVALQIDGAMAYACVWLNGHFIGGWPYGYSSWEVDLTPYLKTGGDNILVIRLDNPQNSSRWYPGGGIYRNVWLVKTAPVHVAHWGTFITTPQISSEAATVKINATVANDSKNKAAPKITTQIFGTDSDGVRSGRAIVSANPLPVEIAAGSTTTVTQTVSLSRPKLWSLENTHGYLALTTVEQDGKVLDRYETPFGVRTIEFAATNGFLLNGKRVQLQGVCDHHDLGALGSALSVRALERQLQLLKEMGCNAIRTSHNPPAPELLDLADRLGFVVMDEAFDCWARAKKPNDYHLLFPDWHEKDLRALVRRDRNHPCVVMWSIGNEIPEQGSSAGQTIGAELAGIVRSEDTTRPVTSACNNANAAFNGFEKNVDVFGYNYKPDGYPKVRQAHPNLPVFGSETASCVSSRGEYFFPVSTNKAAGQADFQVSSYDLYAPRWAFPPDTEFRGLDRAPYAMGEFVWTGFDYLGEPTPYNGDTSNLLNFTDAAEQARLEKELKELGKIQVPSRSSYFGIIDLAGFKKDRFYIYQARWRPELPMAHILPHWSWPDRVGQVVPVHVYTSGDEAELFLNNGSLGRKKKGQSEYRLRWDDVIYEPGELKVIAYKNGKKWAQDSVRTVKAGTQIALSADRPRIKADGEDLCFITATITDVKGQLAPHANHRVILSVNGPGKLIAMDNGDPTSFEPFQNTYHAAFNGLCLGIIRSTGKPGTIEILAGSPSLNVGRLRIKAE
ncbi:MAG TPA: beta-galactosidase GalB [Candidatus Dormibacteraeota bacterium]|nr:beta-galactosidase GalB [Candidatus Dormibacteraeota bacterium]